MSCNGHSAIIHSCNGRILLGSRMCVYRPRNDTQCDGRRIRTHNNYRFDFKTKQNGCLLYHVSLNTWVEKQCLKVHLLVRVYNFNMMRCSCAIYERACRLCTLWRTDYTLLSSASLWCDKWVDEWRVCAKIQHLTMYTNYTIIKNLRLQHCSG